MEGIVQMDLLFHPGSIGPVKPVEGAKDADRTTGKRNASGDFAAVLREVASERPVSFSAHAMRRLSSRGIEPDADVITKLNSAVDKADAKGSKESLVLIDDLAFIVAVKNRTVVTAMDIEQLKEDVVTNIDSAVIL